MDMDTAPARTDLIGTDDLKVLAMRSDRKGIVRMGAHLLIIAAAGWMVTLAGGTAWLLAAWVPYGIALAFLFSPLHECVHRTAFRTRRLNDLAAAICGFILLLPANSFRCFHFAHHRYTNDPQRDPELAAEKPQTVTQYAIAMTGFGSYWWPQIRDLVMHAAGRADEPWIGVRRRRKIVTEAKLHLLTYSIIAGAALATGSTLVLTLWILPVMIGMVFLRLFLLAEHAGCDLVDNMLANTRTTLTSSAVKFLTWNMPYHCEHHLYPAVPFHNLPKLHALVGHRIQTVSPGYLHFHRQFLKLAARRSP